MDKATVRDLANIKGKHVFIRVDFNVPQDEKGKITDDNRIRESLATIRFCLDKGAKVILAGHLGRPDSKEDTKYSLRPIAKRLQQLLPENKVIMAKDCIGKEIEKQVSNLSDGQCLLLENIRYYKEETKNDLDFAKKLAGLADYYINDAFGVAHRAHASTEGITQFIPSVAGFLLEKEIKIMGEAISQPKRPLTVILGGKKVAEKIGVIDNLLGIADTIIIGGGMSFSFIKAQGGEVGDSVVDESRLEYCKSVLEKAKKQGVKVLLPIDCVAADKFDENATTKITEITQIPLGWMGLDIGPASTELFTKSIANAGTIIWNGPMGVFEMEKFQNGTKAICEAVVLATQAVTILCGGDTSYVASKYGLADRFTHISTGGGASLEFIEGKQLPGVTVLLPKDARII